MSNAGWRSAVVDIDRPAESTEYASLTVPGGRITVVLADRPSLGRFDVCLDFEPDEEQVESPVSQPAQEEPLQGAHGEAPPGEGSVSPAGPLPDALPQEGGVVEGVGGDAEDDLGERETVFFESIRNAVDDLHFAYCAVRAAGCGEGNLTLSNDILQAHLVWGDGMGASLRFSASASLPTSDTEEDRPF